jgi:hypothetical protein
MTKGETRMLYYIAVHDAGRTALLAGPYEQEDNAEQAMEAVCRLAYDANPWSWFYTFSLGKSERSFPTRFGIVHHTQHQG